MYDISGSAHFINKCDNGIVIHRNRDKNAGPLDVVQVTFAYPLIWFHILSYFCWNLMICLALRSIIWTVIIGLCEEGAEQSDWANRRCFLDIWPVCPFFKKIFKFPEHGFSLPFGFYTLLNLQTRLSESPNLTFVFLQGYWWIQGCW